MKRAVGYCENVECSAFMAGAFLMNHGESFFCPVCRKQGYIEEEKSIDNNTHKDLYREVRVEFNFDRDWETGQKNDSP